MNLKYILIEVVAILQRMPTWRLWASMVALSLLMAEVITSAMGWLLLGHVPADYLLTGMVVSILVASLVSALILYSAEQTRQLAAHLAESEQRYRIFSNLSSNFIFSCSRKEGEDFHIDWLTGSCEHLFGVSADAMKAKESWRGFVAAMDLPTFDRNITALAPGQSSECELRVRHADGSIRYVQVYARVLPQAGEGDLLRLYGSCQDITENKRFETALIDERHMAEAANVAKSRFLATMSHEIRTPMNGILGMAQLLQMPDVSEAERHDYAQTIVNSGQTLLALLSDILDFSKIEAGKLALDRSAFAPRRVVEEIVTLFARPAQAKSLAIEAVWRGPENLLYSADAFRLRQMLSNLVSNAVKFTEHGVIRVEATDVERNGNEALLEFAVSDDGIGIPPDKLSLLFRPFSQADTSTTREYGGTGLGLSIVRSLAKLMGGEVGVASEEGKGSRFWFRIRAELPQGGAERDPIGAVPTNGQEAAAVAGLTGRILVVEDNLTNRKVVVALLKKLGLRAEAVENGKEAVAAITRGIKPDLVLMDVQMPVMDGFKATECIRQWEQETRQPRLPIVALTAGAFEEDRQCCLAAGMDDFIAKPVRVDTLASVLKKWISADAQALR